MMPSRGSLPLTADTLESANVLIALEQLSAFYTPEEARLWLQTPQPLLNNRCALELLTDWEGRRTVFALIARLKDCAYI